MTLLLKLLLAHITGDFLVQPEPWIKEKNRLKIKSLKFWYHIGIHGVLVFLLLATHTHFWYILGVTVISHALIDLLKIYFQKDQNRIFSFLADQLLHIAVIALLVYWIDPIQTPRQLNTDYLLLVIVYLLLLTWVSAISIKIMISYWTPQTNDLEDESLKKAGWFIGILERLFVFCFIVTGHWEAVGFLLAAKSVFRFGDLKESKDRKLTEYILIGTLLSFGSAMGCGIMFVKLASMIQ